MSVLIRLAFVSWLLLATLSTVSARLAAAEPEPAASEAEQAASDTQPPAADEAPAPSQDQPPAPEAGPQPKGPPFDQLFPEWQTLLSDLRGLRLGHATAEPKRQEEIKTRFDQLTAQGEAMVPQLVRAAQEAYAKTPGGDPIAGEFLMGAVVHQSRSEEYEAVLTSAEILIEGGYSDKGVYALAGLAAVATGQFDAAGEYLKTADEHRVFGALTLLASEHPFQELGSFYKELVPYYQEAWPKEEKIRAAEAEADDLPRVLLSTNKGDIEIELFENEAPNTVANFVSLVEKGYYNGTAFHRVLPGFMAQGGSADGTGGGGPGYTIKCECTKPNHRVHFRGSLSMAKPPVPDTGGSQFFLTFVPTMHLDGKHTVFGRIVEGIEVLAKIQRRSPETVPPPLADKILEAKILRKRDHEYVPETTAE